MHGIRLDSRRSAWMYFRSELAAELRVDSRTRFRARCRTVKLVDAAFLTLEKQRHALKKKGHSGIMILCYAKVIIGTC